MANPASAFPSAPPKFFDNGSGAKFLQPQNQSVYVANPTDLATCLVAVIAIRDCCVNAGLMLPS